MACTGDPVVCEGGHCDELLLRFLPITPTWLVSTVTSFFCQQILAGKTDKALYTRASSPLKVFLVKENLPV